MITTTNFKGLTTQLEKGIYTYEAYKELMKSLFEGGKSTAKEDSQELVDYTKLNIARMKRLDKTIKVDEALKAEILKIQHPVEWIVISEGWCADSAQNLPVINAIAKLNPNIKLTIVLRDEHPELMDQFLTNGNRAIPKLIQVDNKEVTATWGPRPTEAANLVKAYVAKHGKVDPEFKAQLQVWYTKNKGASLMSDFLNILS